jgi:Fe-S-cluster-containing hydrogenase component 2
MPNRLKISPEKCIGCKSCELACALANEQEINPGRSRITLISFINENRGLPYHLALTCKQCADAPCLESCPADAIGRSKDSLKVIEIDYERCTQCGQCVVACPFGAMYFDEEKQVPFKCTLCAGEPACESLCPTEAIVFVQQRAFSARPQSLHVRGFDLLRKLQSSKLQSDTSQQ